jgi:thymidylate kinase
LGAIVAVVGPDGSGKSTLVGCLRAQLSSDGKIVTSINFRPKIISRRRRAEDSHNTANPHDQPQNSPARGIAKLLVLFIDIWLGAAAWPRIRREQRRFHIIERHAYDFVVDPFRLRLGRTSRQIRVWFCRMSPKPDLIIVCSGPAEAIFARKAEISLAEIERQLREWNCPELFAPGVPIISWDTTAEGDVSTLFCAVKQSGSR